MILNKWKVFNTDSEVYTQKVFEDEIKDQFEAMVFEKGKQIPSYIWTNQHVVIVKTNTRMIKDVSFIKVPRHPESF